MQHPMGYLPADTMNVSLITRRHVIRKIQQNTSDTEMVHELQKVVLLTNLAAHCVSVGQHLNSIRYSSIHTGVSVCSLPQPSPRATHDTLQSLLL